MTQRLQEFERIYAPFDGVITARNTDIGALIQNGDNTVPKELFHLAEVDKLRVYISVPEVYATAVKPDEMVTLTLDAFTRSVLSLAPQSFHYNQGEVFSLFGAQPEPSHDKKEPT